MTGEVRKYWNVLIQVLDWRVLEGWRWEGEHHHLPSISRRAALQASQEESVWALAVVSEAFDEEGLLVEGEDCSTDAMDPRLKMPKGRGWTADLLEEGSVADDIQCLSCLPPEREDSINLPWLGNGGAGGDGEAVLLWLTARRRGQGGGRGEDQQDQIEQHLECR